jgi:hypothetical protein
VEWRVAIQAGGQRGEELAVFEAPLRVDPVDRVGARRLGVVGGGELVQCLLGVCSAASRGSCTTSWTSAASRRRRAAKRSGAGRWLDTAAAKLAREFESSAGSDVRGFGTHLLNGRVALPGCTAARGERG